LLVSREAGATHINKLIQIRKM